MLTSGGHLRTTGGTAPVSRLPFLNGCSVSASGCQASGYLTWVRVLADVLGRELRVSPTPHASALGGYACAAKAIGEFGTLEEAAETLARKLQTVHPDPAAHLEYQDYYKRWSRLQHDLDGMPL